MSIPTEITFHELEASPAAEAAIERWVARLEQIHDRILHAHAIVSVPHRHGRHREFEVHLKLDISGAEIVTRLARHEDVYVAIADAFRAARRQLLDELDNRRGYGRAPSVTPHASVV